MKHTHTLPFLFSALLLSACNGNEENISNPLSTNFEEHSEQELSDTNTDEDSNSDDSAITEDDTTEEDTEESNSPDGVTNSTENEDEANNTVDQLNSDATNPETQTNTSNGKKIILNHIAAFPTAYGAGAVATGGRGGNVVYVTNTNSYGKGSFREALTHANPAEATTIMFAIGGQFDIGNDLTDPNEASLYLVGQNNITIAGQTANDLGGVNIMSSNPKDGRIYLTESENFIIRYASIQGQGDKFRYGNIGKYAPLTFASSNTLIFDHYTGGYSSYGVLAGGYNPKSKKASGVTIQNSLFHENVGNHNVSIIAGMLVSDFNYNGAFPSDSAKHKAWNTLTSDQDLHHNAYILNDHRQPGNLEGGEQGSIKAISNYIYGWGQRTSAGAGSLKVDLINNVYEQNREGNIANDKLFKHHFQDDDKILAVDNPPETNPSYLISGNQILENNGAEFLSPSNKQWQIITETNTHEPLSKDYQRLTPQPKRLHPIPVTATQNVKQKVLANAGAGIRYFADGVTTNANPIDTKYLNIARDKTGPSKQTENVYPYDKPDGNIGDPTAFFWPDYESKTRDLETYDNDLDGLPDTWEVLHKVSDPNGHKTNWQIQGYEIINNAGYTNLDMFLAEIAGDFHQLANQ